MPTKETYAKMSPEQKQQRLEYNSVYGKNHPNKRRKWAKTWHDKNRKHVREYAKTYGKAKQKDGAARCLAKNRELKHKYHGFTLAQLEQMIQAQNKKCACCFDSLPKEQVFEDGNTLPSRFIRLDHDHETNQIRGVLCHHCNSGLGMFRDSPERLQNAIDYLKRSLEFENVT